MRRGSALIALAVCACLAMSGVAAGAAPTDLLTTSEYQQLKTAQTQLRDLGSHGSLARFRRICEGLQPSTALMYAKRADCLAMGRFGFDGIEANAAADRCTARGSTVAQMDRCMLPSFETYRASTHAYYVADRHVDTVAHARGFSNSCVAVLGNSQRIVAAENRLAVDLNAFVNALRHASLTGLQAAAKRVDADGRSVGGSAASVARCPHQ
jgi:hypothetical protein